MPAACVVSVELDDPGFLCETAPFECPDGFVCIEGRCQLPDDGPEPTSFRRALTVADGVNVTAGSVLVTLRSDRIDYAKTQPDGSDIEFRDDVGTVLDHEVELWDPSGDSLVWVRLGELPANRTLYLHYGGASKPAAGQTVWADFDVVYHFNGGVGDSGPNGYDGGLENGGALGAGRLGAGVTLDGIDDRVFGGTDLDLVRATSGMTAALWARPAMLGASLMEITNNAGDATRMFISLQSTGEVRFGLREDDIAGPSVAVTTVKALALDEWVWIVVTANLEAQTMQIYLDGVLEAEGVGLELEPISVDANAAQLILGQDDGAAMTGSFAGSLDEAQILSRFVDSDWVEEHYLSMSDQLITFGAEEPLFD